MPKKYFKDDYGYFKESKSKPVSRKEDMPSKKYLKLETKYYQVGRATRHKVGNVKKQD